MRILAFFILCLAVAVDAVADGWVSASTLYFKAATEQQTLHIETDLSWSLTKDQSWVTTSLGSGLYSKDITVTCSPNTTSASREATIRIVEADQTEHIIVVLQQAPVLSISHQYQYLTGAEGSSSIFEITSNADWTITGAPVWFTISQASGSLTKGITVTAVKNSSTTTRSAVLDITVVGAGTKQIKIAQLADGENFTLNVSKSTIDLPGNSAGTGVFDITSNIGWTIQSSESWLKLDTIYGENNVSPQITADINPDPVPRTANISITGQCSSTNSISKQIVVTQAGNPYIQLSSSNMQVDHHEVFNTMPLTITANSNWSASSSQTWASLSTSTGTGNGTVNVNVQANPTNVSRSALITFTSSYGKTAQLTITQLGAPSSLAVSSNAVTIGATEASEVSVQVTANFTGWTVSGSETWLTVQRLNNTPSSVVKLIAAANPGTATRTATVTIEGESIVRTITVTQAEKTDRVVLSANTLSLYTQGVFSISADIAWTLSCSQSWLSASPVSGSANATITVTAQTNPTTAVRHGNIVVTSSEGTKSIEIVQEGASPYLFTDINTGKLYISSTEGSTADVNISTNDSWTAESNQSWLTVSDASGSSGKKISLTASFNKSQISRTATVTVKCTGITETIEVTQYGSPAFVQVTETSLEIGSADNSVKSISVVSNTDWQVSSSASWLTPSITSGSGDAGITLSATENTTLDYRTANVTITAGAITKVVQVSQSSNAVQLSVSTTNLNIENSMVTFDITTNTTWHAACSESWFYTISTSGTGNATVSVGATANTTGAPRTGTITVSVTGKNQIITVTQPAAETVTVSKASINYEATAGSNSFDITSTSSWTITCPEQWITLSTMNGTGDATVTVTASANTSGIQRTASISVSDNVTTKTITVTQSSDMLTVSAGSMQVESSEGSTASFNITSNVNWTITSSQPWLTASTNSGNGNSTIQLTATANPDASERTATVTVTNGTIQRQITVVQAAKPSGTLTVSSTQIEIAGISGSQATFTITSNTSWLVSCSDSWVTLTGNSGSGNGTVTITAGENYDDFSRTSTLKIFYDGQLQTITLTQKAQEVLEVSGNSLQVENVEGSTASFDITSNVSWTVNSSESWLSASITSGNGNSKIQLTAAANSSSSERTATVTVTNGTIQRKITVTQAAKTPGTLAVSATQIEIAGISGSQATFTITSNTSWVVSCNDSWVTLTGYSGNGNGTVTITVDGNNDLSSRTSTIKVSYDGQLQTITLIQKATEVLEVSVNNLQFASTPESTASFNITSNVNWTISSSQPWLTASINSGNGNSTIQLSVTANPNNTERTATVTVTNGTIQKQINISQAAAIQTGIDGNVSEGIAVYPNPVAEGFRVKGLQSDATIILTDINGKCIFEKLIHDDEFILINTLKQGTYILSLKMKSTTITQRIVKK